LEGAQNGHSGSSGRFAIVVAAFDKRTGGLQARRPTMVARVVITPSKVRELLVHELHILDVKSLGEETRALDAQFDLLSILDGGS